ncbi:TPA: hypothetical protein UL927_000174 [Stenotrophomonas maltophilia]|nr:hypothetical protein [Stenotrophomonas maltophilia]HEL7666842.1 hypothetical protein [Stenotrophomonas maltophilia]
MLKRLRRWWLRRHAPCPMAPEQMQALVDINLLEIQLAALDALKPSTPAAEATRLRSHAWLASVRGQGPVGTPNWSELRAEARALNRDLAAALAAAHVAAPSET